MDIKPALIEDLITLNNLEQAVFSANAWHKEDIAAMLSLPTVFGFIAYSGKVPVGYVLGQWVEDVGEILTIGVLKTHRRKGFAEQLIKHLFSKMKSDGVYNVTLEVKADNNAAKGIYTKLGGVKVGVRRKYYNNKEDALIYQFNL